MAIESSSPQMAQLSALAARQLRATQPNASARTRELTAKACAALDRNDAAAATEALAEAITYIVVLDQLEKLAAAVPAPGHG